MNNPTPTGRIELAFTNIDQQEHPDILETANTYVLLESTLRRRWKGQSLSR